MSLVVFAVVWLLLGYLGNFIFNRYLNKKYPFTYQTKTVEDIFDIYCILFGPVNLVMTLVYILVNKR